MDFAQHTIDLARKNVEEGGRPFPHPDPPARRYRVYPNAGDKSVYFDIIHAPTNHLKPGA
jgi:hypothetical protein